MRSHLFCKSLLNESHHLVKFQKLVSFKGGPSLVRAFPGACLERLHQALLAFELAVDPRGVATLWDTAVYVSSCCGLPWTSLFHTGGFPQMPGHLWLPPPP